MAINHRKLTNLLALASSSYRTGSIEDSHDLFDLFMQEVITASAEDERQLAESINSVIASALVDEDALAASLEGEEVVAGLDTDDEEHESDDDLHLSSSAFFGGDSDIQESDFEVFDTPPPGEDDEPLADPAVIASADRASAIAANLRALKGE